MLIKKTQARKFLLMKHGLYGDRPFRGEQGIMEFIRQAGCIQYDPIDICGKNPELVLQSRIDGFLPEQLYKLLYDERKLMDCWDKNMAILPVEDWPFMSRRRNHAKKSSRNSEEILAAGEKLKKYIGEHGPICSSDVNMGKKVDWFWAPTSVSRASLESLFLKGELGIHHKKNTIRYYDLIEHILDPKLLKEKDPNEYEEDFYEWYILRRLGAVGMLTARNSDSFLGIVDLDSEKRKNAFEALEEEGVILSIEVEGALQPYYIKSEDLALMNRVMADQAGESDRMEFIAPLDNLLWDRKIIAELFDFEYKWEIYTPEKDRKYGYYVLPILYGERFIGRVEPVRNRKDGTLEQKGIWWEPGITESTELKKKLKETAARFAKFNQVKVGKKWGR